MGIYGQFCPVAKAVELLDERWTLLVIRELLTGSRHFNEIRRGVPRMSPALLSKRLTRLMRAGVVDRFTDGNRVTYRLSPAGEELRPIVESLGAWGVRWVPELGEEDLDPHLLMWDIHRTVPRDELPPGRTTVRFTFRDVPPGSRDWWLVLAPDGADVCDFDPGHPVVATVDTGLRTLVRVWRGDLGWREAVRAGDLSVTGTATARRAVPRWIGQGYFAAVPRIPAGRASNQASTARSYARPNASVASR